MNPTEAELFMDGADFMANITLNNMKDKINNNIEEDYVSFEMAKLLKEKEFGLSENCYIQLYSYYDEEGVLQSKPEAYISRKYNKLDTHLGADIIDDFETHISYFDNSLDGIYLAPTIALAIKWIRENFGIHISTNSPTHELITWEYSIQTKLPSYHRSLNKHFKTFVEAENAALLYTLKNLI